MATYRSVRVSELTKAFAAAHRYAINASTTKDRAKFRQVARLIWEACGEYPKELPATLPENLRDLAVIQESELMGPANAPDRAR